MNKFYFRILIIIVFGFVLSGCGDPPEGSFEIGKIRTKFVTPASNQTLNMSRSLTNQNEEISAMYFGLLNIAAIQYSPGYEGFADYVGNQKNFIYYNILDDKQAEARDIVLKNGGEIDFSTLNPYKFELNDHFKENFDNFSVDFLEVYVAGSGIFFNDVFYGMGDDDDEWVDALIEKYPFLETFTVYDFGFPLYNVMEGFEYHDVSFSVAFARPDWFNEPVFVRLTDGYTGPNPEPYEVEWSNKDLSDEQKTLVEGLANHPSASWYRRNFIIIPYSGDPVKFALNEDAEGMLNPEFRISFDFTQLLTDETYNNINNDGDWSQSPEGPNPAFTYRSADSIPFGLSVSIVDSN